MKKSKVNWVFDIILLINTLFIVSIFLEGLYNAIFGYTFCFIQCNETIYGIKALIDSFIWIIVRWIFIPVLPIVYLYDLIYIIIYSIKRKFSKMGKILLLINLFMLILGLILYFIR